MEVVYNIWVALVSGAYCFSWGYNHAVETMSKKLAAEYAKQLYPPEGNRDEPRDRKTP